MMIYIVFAIVCVCLCVLSYKFGYDIGHIDGDSERDNKATKECYNCVLRITGAKISKTVEPPAIKILTYKCTKCSKNCGLVTFDDSYLPVICYTGLTPKWERVEE